MLPSLNLASKAPFCLTFLHPLLKGEGNEIVSTHLCEAVTCKTAPRNHTRMKLFFFQVHNLVAKKWPPSISPGPKVALCYISKHFVLRQLPLILSHTGRMIPQTTDNSIRHHAETLQKSRKMWSRGRSLTDHMIWEQESRTYFQAVCKGTIVWLVKLSWCFICRKTRQ